MRLYKVVMRPSAEKSLARIPEPTRTRLAVAIRELAYDPRPAGSIKLTGRPLYRIRCGDYRVVYSIADEIVTVTVTKTAHRKDACR